MIDDYSYIALVFFLLKPTIYPGIFPFLGFTAGEGSCISLSKRLNSYLGSKVIKLVILCKTGLILDKNVSHKDCDVRYTNLLVFI